MEKCVRCSKYGTHNELSIPNGEHLLNEWLCLKCLDVYFFQLNKFNENFIQPERSKREDSEYGAKCDFGILKSEMRCSEQSGNRLRDK